METVNISVMTSSQCLSWAPSPWHLGRRSHLASFKMPLQINGKKTSKIHMDSFHCPLWYLQKPINKQGLHLLPSPPFYFICSHTVDPAKLPRVVHICSLAATTKYHRWSGFKWKLIFHSRGLQTEIKVSIRLGFFGGVSSSLYSGSSAGKKKKIHLQCKW